MVIGSGSYNIRIESQKKNIIICVDGIALSVIVFHQFLDHVAKLLFGKRRKISYSLGSVSLHHGNDNIKAEILSISPYRDIILTERFLDVLLFHLQCFKRRIIR